MMSDERKPVDKIVREHLAQNNPLPPEKWHIKITSYSAADLDPIFPLEASLVTLDLMESFYLSTTSKGIKVVGAYHEKQEEDDIIHQYLTLDGRLDYIEQNLKEDGHPVPDRETLVENILKSRHFFSFCIANNVIKVEDSQGNILDVKNLIIPFIPGSIPMVPAPEGPQ
jgi:hypothetical protein